MTNRPSGPVQKAIRQEGGHPDVLVIGVGNPFRQDDGLGLSVIDALARQSLPASVKCIKASGEGFQLLSLWEGYGRVIVCDAVVIDAPPGKLIVFEVDDRPLEKDLFPFSTHNFSLAETVELARSLGQLPERLTIVGVAGENFEYGEGLSAAVGQAVPAAAQAIRAQLDIVD